MNALTIPQKLEALQAGNDNPNIFGMSKEDLVDYQEGEEDYLDYFAPYPEDEEDCPEDEGTTGRPSDPSS